MNLNIPSEEAGQVDEPQSKNSLKASRDWSMILRLSKGFIPLLLGHGGVAVRTSGKIPTVTAVSRDAVTLIM
jgi:hypothetical protein